MKEEFGIQVKAFTLAEVLITLGIIGIVAAITIPNLITKYQKRVTVIKLRKAMSVLNQAVKLSYNELGEVSPEEAHNMGSEAYFNTYWKPYFKVLKYCPTYDVCGYDARQPYVSARGGAASFGVTADGFGVTFLTGDGFLYVIRIAQGNLSTLSRWIAVDLNGPKKPNQYGKDLFFLIRLENVGGGVDAYGYDLTDKEINNSCSKTGGGDYCAEKIKRAGWKIDDSYPW